MATPLDILFVSGNPHLPQVIGGVEINTHALASDLTRRGYKVAIAAKLSLRDWFGLCRMVRATVTRKQLILDRDLGYPVYRSRHLARAISELPRPAVAVLQNGDMIELAGGFARVGVPCVAYFHSLGFEQWQTAAKEAAHRSLPFCGYMAVSRFTASRFHALYGLQPLSLPPFFRPESYRTSADGKMVTFVNPVPSKGLRLALEIAALCPGIPFCFVCAWPLGPFEWLRLKRGLRALPNVTLSSRTEDMRSVYANTRLLLVPSPSETWGRVVSEAHLSGIPVIASDRGGLPEAVGPGGIVLRYEDCAKEWARTVEKLYSDGRLHRKLSRAARQYAVRPELEPNHLVDTLLNALTEFAGCDLRSGAAPATKEHRAA